jgi:hypothetical protein
MGPRITGRVRIPIASASWNMASGRLAVSSKCCPIFSRGTFCSD